MPPAHSGGSGAQRRRTACPGPHSQRTAGQDWSPGAPPAVACFVEKLGHLRGLPAARLATHDDDGVLGHRLHDHLFLGQNRELQAFPLQREEGSTREPGSPAPRLRGPCSERDDAGRRVSLQVAAGCARAVRTRGQGVPTGNRSLGSGAGDRDASRALQKARPASSGPRRAARDPGPGNAAAAGGGSTGRHR